jgi:hypothetical protein
MEMETHSEHKENDTDLGKLGRELRVSHEAGSVRSDSDPGNQISYNRGKTQTLRDEAEYQGPGKAERDSSYKRYVVHKLRFPIERALTVNFENLLPDREAM